MQNISEEEKNFLMSEAQLTFIKIIDNRKNIIFKVIDSNKNKRAIKRIDKVNFKKLEMDISLKEEFNFKGIIRIHNHFFFKRYHYLVYDYYKLTLKKAIQILNGSLSSQISERHVFSIKQSWSRQLCEICKKLQDNNVLHRDLKPQNILMSSAKILTAEIVLIDFGSCTDNIEHSDSQYMSLKYCAPELLDSDKSTSKSDVWSYGQIIYKIFTNKIVDNKSSEEQIMTELRESCKNYNLFNMLRRCLTHFEKRASFNELLSFPILTDTVILNSNDPCKKIKSKLSQASCTILFLKHKQPKLLRKFWVESIHHPVLFYVQLYFKKKFEKLLHKYASQVSGSLLKVIEQKIIQFTLPNNCEANIDCLEHLINLYEDCESIDKNEKGLLKVLKSALNSINNPN